MDAVDLFWSALAAVGSLAAVGWLIWIGATGDRDREEEEEAREFFDRHGHWPDEAPPASSGEVEDARPGGQAPRDLGLEERA